MRSTCRTLHTEFKFKLRRILSCSPARLVSLGEFIELLTVNSIRMFSRVEVARLSKLFENSAKVCRVEGALSHLLLDCVQESDRQRYLYLYPQLSIVKVSTFPVNPGLCELAGPTAHTP
jgi:hypothetical protein